MNKALLPLSLALLLGNVHAGERVDLLVRDATVVDVVSGTLQPHRRESPKLGRNDPCPCGSGRKYKKCHGALTDG